MGEPSGETRPKQRQNLTLSGDKIPNSRETNPHPLMDARGETDGLREVRPKIRPTTPAIPDGPTRSWRSG